MQGLHDGKNLCARRLQKRCNKHAGRFSLSARFDNLMKPIELEPLRDFEFFLHGHHLLIRQDERFFVGEMKDNSLFFYLQIAAEYLDEFEQTQSEPAFILGHVDVNVDIDEYRKEKEERSEKSRINKKFAHIRNMSERLKNYLFS